MLRTSEEGLIYIDTHTHKNILPIYSYSCMQIFSSLSFQTIISNHLVTTTTIRTHARTHAHARAHAHTPTHTHRCARWLYQVKTRVPQWVPTFLLPPSLHVHLEGNTSLYLARLFQQVLSRFLFPKHLQPNKLFSVSSFSLRR